MLRPCLGYPGPCPDGATTTARRCPPCQSRYEAARPARRVRGRYDSRWVRLRRIAIGRQPWCSVCKTAGTPDNPLTGDHIVPLERGGRSVMANIDVLCRVHNSQKRDRIGASNL